MADASVTPKELGAFQRFLSKAWPTMSAEDRTALVAEAALPAANELAKASKEMERGPEHKRVDQVEDQWDGPPDARLDTVRAGGPGSAIPSGDVGVGPRQAASGDGALRMERHYSDHARQSGVEEATNRLGRELAKARGDLAHAQADVAKALAVVKSLLSFGETMSTRVALLESTAVTAKALSVADVEAVVAKAVSKSIVAFAKAMEEGEEMDDEEDDEVAKAIVKIVAKAEEEAKDEKEEHEEEEAAKARLISKGLLKIVRQVLVKAEEEKEDKKESEFKKHMEKSKALLAKARRQITIAKALGSSASALASLDRGVNSVAKAIREQAENQDIWPESTARRVGTETAKAADAVASEELAKAAEKLSKAASGMGMMNATLQQVATAVMGQRHPESSALPPAFALAKARDDHRGADAVQAHLMRMVDDNIIPMADYDRASDILGKARMGLPVDNMVASLPDVVQAVLRPAAA